MFLVSQNLLNYDMGFPADTVLRVNLAWVANLHKLEETLSKSNLDFFIDIPSGRIKPPNNRYEVSDLLPIFKKYNNVKFLAVSNVETPSIIKEYLDITENNLHIVPKIETIKGVNNIKAICEAMPNKKYVMLDHDDLFTNVIKNKGDSEMFINLVDDLVRFCKNNGVCLLRARGIIFSDEI